MTVQEYVNMDKDLPGREHLKITGKMNCYKVTKLLTKLMRMRITQKMFVLLTLDLNVELIHINKHNAI